MKKSFIFLTFILTLVPYLTIQEEDNFYTILGLDKNATTK